MEVVKGQTLPGQGREGYEIREVVQPEGGARHAIGAAFDARVSRDKNHMRVCQNVKNADRSCASSALSAALLNPGILYQTGH